MLARNRRWLRRRPEQVCQTVELLDQLFVASRVVAQKAGLVLLFTWKESLAISTPTQTVSMFVLILVIRAREKSRLNQWFELTDKEQADPATNVRL